MTLTTLPRRRRVKPKLRHTQGQERQRQRVLELQARPISFVPNPEFPSAPDSGTNPTGAGGEAPATRSTEHQPPRGLPPHLARLSEVGLLNAAEEQVLFRRMNYLKYRARALRDTLDPDSPDLETLNTVERYLEEAQAIRERIVRANVRLAMSVVKKFVTPQQSFDELLSDGLLALLKAVDKFDFSRGFRFSTYAYRAIARNASQNLARQASQQRHQVQLSAAEPVDDARREKTIDERSWERLRSNLAEMMTHLDPREQFVVRSRFALGSQLQARTLQSLAEELGVSKERVRQLEQRAILKLNRLASAQGMENWGEPVSA